MEDTLDARLARIEALLAKVLELLPAPRAKPRPVPPQAALLPPESMAQEMPVLVFETAGDPAKWSLTSKHLAELEALFPAQEVLTNLRQARGYLAEVPAKRKTAAGMPRFLGNWLRRVQDTGKGAFKGTAGRPPPRGPEVPDSWRGGYRK